VTDAGSATAAACMSHARASARRAKMRGLDPHVVGAAFIAQGLRLIYEIDDAPALELTKHCIAFSLQVLSQALIDDLEASGAATGDQLDRMRKRMASDLALLQTKTSVP
jgi:hypothetical protein